MMPVDVTKPNIARMYDYWLGGKDNFEADRTAAEAVRAQRPNIAEQALDNKRFQTRAVTYAAAARRVRRAGSSTERAARRVAAGSGPCRSRRASRICRVVIAGAFSAAATARECRMTALAPEGTVNW